MQKLSTLLNILAIGNHSEAASHLKAVTIDNTNGNVTNWATGNDLAMGESALAGQFVAERVWNSYWNDVVDFQTVCDEVVFGKCYYDTFDGAKICHQRNQMSVIGIASDTFGFAVGKVQSKNQVPIAIGGWVLAYVDKSYESGTVLTNDAQGNLTMMSRDEKLEFPERMVGIYKKPEYDQFIGTESHKIEVKGRHWVKVK